MDSSSSIAALRSWVIWERLTPWAENLFQEEVEGRSEKLSLPNGNSPVQITNEVRAQSKTGSGSRLPSQQEEGSRLRTFKAPTISSNAYGAMGTA